MPSHECFASVERGAFKEVLDGRVRSYGRKKAKHGPEDVLGNFRPCKSSTAAGYEVLTMTQPARRRRRAPWSRTRTSTKSTVGIFAAFPGARA